MSIRSLSFSVIPLTLLLLLTLGIGLILAGRRGGARHPACLGCGYDVTGSVGKTDRCPECGELFTDVGIAAPRTARRPVMMGFGIAIVVICVTCLLGMAGSLLLYGARSAATIPAPNPAPTPAPAGAPSGPSPAEAPPAPQSEP